MGFADENKNRITPALPVSQLVSISTMTGNTFPKKNCFEMILYPHSQRQRPVSAVTHAAYRTHTDQSYPAGHAAWAHPPPSTDCQQDLTTENASFCDRDKQIKSLQHGHRWRCCSSLCSAHAGAKQWKGLLLQQLWFEGENERSRWFGSAPFVGHRWAVCELPVLTVLRGGGEPRGDAELSLKVIERKRMMLRICGVFLASVLVEPKGLLSLSLYIFYPVCSTWCLYGVCVSALHSIGARGWARYRCQVFQYFVHLSPPTLRVCV